MECSRSKVLIIEDDKSFVNAVKIALRKTFVGTDWATNAQEALSLLKEKSPYAVVIIDQHLPGIRGDELAIALRKQYPELQIIFATGDLTQGTLTNLLQTGVAVGFIPKGATTDILLSPILKAVQIYEQERRILLGETTTMLEAERKLFAAGIIGRSQALLDVLRRIEAFHRIQFPTLILGESGTGKEVIANAFAKGITEVLPVNCSTFKDRENTMEAELFGVIKGAYTGADRDRKGLFEIAKGRIIFLDEIHHLSIAAQAKLLRVLQEKKTVRLGDTSDNSIQCDFKIICAGKPEIYDMMKAGTFLPDLFYRIATNVVNIPPLSERKEDIEPLVEYFAKELRYQTKIQKYFRAATIRMMESYAWPGEARELRAMVEILFAETKSDIIEPKDFAATLKQKYQSTQEIDFEAVDYDAYMKTIETDYIISILCISDTQKEAAQKMGLSKSTLNNRLRILGIDADGYLRSKQRKKKDTQKASEINIEVESKLDSV